MNDMARSAIYDAFHEIIPLIKELKNFPKKLSLLAQFVKVVIRLEFIKVIQCLKRVTMFA